MAKRILIIDDDSRNIFALTAVLKSRGYAVWSANNVDDGLDILIADKTIDVVLMDMMMPDVDGYEGIAMIREKPQTMHIPVFAVTAQAMVGDREKCIAAGANEYLAKPVDVDALVELIEKYKVKR